MSTPGLMSDRKNVGPYHAKDVGSGQETADTLAQVLKHAAAREEAAKKTSPSRRTPRWMLPLGVNLSVLAVYLLIAPPAWIVLSPIQAPPMEIRVEGLRTAMYFQANRVESFRIANGRLPATLEECCGLYEGIEYYPRGPSSYQLIGFVGDVTVSYDSSQPLVDWAADLDLARKTQG